MPKKLNKDKAKIHKKLKVIEHKENLDKSNEKVKLIDKREIEENQFIIKNILPDGNCFYQTISYYFRDTEDDHTEFRTLILDYIQTNIEEYIPFVSDDDIKIKIENNLNEKDIKNKKIEYIKAYINNARIKARL